MFPILSCTTINKRDILKAVEFPLQQTIQKYDPPNIDTSASYSNGPNGQYLVQDLPFCDTKMKPWG